MSVDWSDQLDEIYESHQMSVENDLRKMVDAFAASVSESPSKGIKVRRFFESLCHTVSNICNGVRTESIDNKKALKMNSTRMEKNVVSKNVVYDNNEMRGIIEARNRRDSESTQSEWSTKGISGFSARSDWPTDRSVGNQSKMNADMKSKIDDANMASDSRCSTSLISENDIDRYLDFKRTDVVKKRKCGRESDEYSAKKRNRRVWEEQRRPNSSRRDFRKSKRNHHAKLKPNRMVDSKKTDFRIGKGQLSNDAAQRLRSVTASFFDAELNYRNKIRAYCYFCEEKLEISYIDWSEHLLMHTGEHSFYCTGCNVGLPKYQSEHCVRYKTKPQIKSGNMTAYLCTECDYIQFNMNRVIDHIVSVHMRSEQDVENTLEKVILMPDLRLMPKLARTKYEYVSNKCRYGCGIKGCNIMGNSTDQFIEHFMHKHSNARMFSCPHCKDIITNVTWNTHSFIDDILSHYKYHNDMINQCSVCDLTFHSDYAVIQHFLTSHTDKCCNFYREFRANLLQRFEDVVILFECNRCYARLVENPIQHYLMCHHSHHADFKLIELVKQMDNERVTKFKMVEFDESILFQQHFSCGWCHEILSTKSQLIRHHIVQHRSNELNIEFKLNLIRSSYHSKLLAINSRFDQYLIYFCDNCDNSDQMNCLFYSDVEDVYNHWTDNHSKGENSKSFRFTLAQLVECYHCKFISTFYGMKVHHNQIHPNEIFSIRNMVDRTKCGLCLADHRLAPTTHFQQQHKTILKANLFNPIALDGDTLTRLRNLKGHTKRMCLHCSEVFETKNDFKIHSARKHPFGDAKSKKIHNNECIHLVTGCCRETIKPTELLEHLKAHDFTSASLLTKYYWNTLAVFGNGLVLEMYSLIRCREFLNSNQIQELIENMKAEN